MGICKHDARSPDPHAVVKASAAFPNAATLSAHDPTVFIYCLDLYILGTANHAAHYNRHLDTTRSLGSDYLFGVRLAYKA